MAGAKTKKKQDDGRKRLLRTIVTDFAGAESEKLVELLFGKANVNEFLIAKKMNLTINQTRNMLYKLADQGLVRFIRKKDKKKGGWYTYFWTLEMKRSLIKYKDRIHERQAELHNEINTMKNQRHYYCQYCDLSYTEEQALLNDYICPECGQPLELKDTSDLVTQIEKELAQLNQLDEHLSQEIVDIEDREEKAKERRLAAEKKQKDDERRARRLEREKEKKKLQKAAKKSSKPAQKKTAKKTKVKKKSAQKSARKRK